MIHNVWPHRSSVCFLCQKKAPTIKMLDCMGFVFRCFLQDHPICAPLRLCCCRTSQFAQHPEHIPTLNPSWNSEVLNQMHSAQIWNTWGRTSLDSPHQTGLHRLRTAHSSDQRWPWLHHLTESWWKIWENVGKYGKMRENMGKWWKMWEMWENVGKVGPHPDFTGMMEKTTTNQLGIPYTSLYRQSSRLSWPILLVLHLWGPWTLNVEWSLFCCKLERGSFTGAPEHSGMAHRHTGAEFQEFPRKKDQ